MRVNVLKFLCAFFVGQTSLWAQELSTPVQVSPQPTQPSIQVSRIFGFQPQRAIGNVLQGIGYAVADTVVQTSSFAGNLLSLNLLEAFGNLGNIISRRSIDSTITQLVRYLPAIIENEKFEHVNAGALNGRAISSYLTDKELTEDEAAVLFRFLLDRGNMLVTDRKNVIGQLQSTLKTLKSGSGKSTDQIGQELGQAMHAAIEAAPRPAPLVGNPLNKVRQLAISRNFLLQAIYTQGVGFSKGIFDPLFKQLEEAGVHIQGLDNKEIGRLIDIVLTDIDLRGCLNQVTEMKQMPACLTKISQDQTRTTGSVLSYLKDPLLENEIVIALKHPKLGGTVDLGQHLGRVLQSNPALVDAVRFRSDKHSLNDLVNHTVREVASEVGKKVVDNALRDRIHNSERLQRIKGNATTLIDNLKNKLNLIEHDGGKLSVQVQAMIKSTDDGKANPVLDKKLRGPFVAALKEKSSKVALLGLALEAIPVSEKIKEEAIRYFQAGLQSNGSLRLPAAVPAHVASFINDFNSTLESFASIPANERVIDYLKSFGDPKSLRVNQLLGKMKNGTGDFLKYFITCDNTQAQCSDGVQEPIARALEFLRDGSVNLKNQEMRKICTARVPAVIDDVLEQIEKLKTSLLVDPWQLVLGVATPAAQQALHCVLVGAALKQGLDEKNAKVIYSSLEATLAADPRRRADLIDRLYAYLSAGQGDARKVAQKSLLLETALVARHELKSLAHRYLGEGIEKSDPNFWGTWARQQAPALHSLTDRFVENLDLLDENTPLSLNEYAKQLADKPLNSGGALDRAIFGSLKETLHDAQARREILTSVLGFDSAWSKHSIMGDGLRERIIAAYKHADLSGEKAEFAPGTDPALEGVLSSFDDGLQDFIKLKQEGESTLDFLRSLKDINSRKADQILAGQGAGLKNLILSMLKCDPKQPSLFCKGCMGGAGNWVLYNEAKKTSEVLIKAPAAMLLDILKIGMSPSPDAAMNATCAREVPLLVERVIEQASDKTNASSVLQDPTQFLNALKKSEAQSALNCILANYAEKRFLEKVRFDYAPFDALAHTLLQRKESQAKLSLLSLNGAQIFHALERRKANSEIFKLKSALLNSVSAEFENDNRATRHALSIGVQDLLRSLILLSGTDNSVAFGLIKGFPFDPALRAKGESSPIGRALLMCIDQKFSRAILPLALFLSENLARTPSQFMQNWVDKGSGNSVNTPLKSENGTTPQVEACASMPAVKSTDKNAESTPWVGGYEHTLEAHTKLGLADGGLVLNSGAKEKVLSQAASFQRLFSASNPKGGAFEKLFEVYLKTPDGIAVYKNLGKAAKFPVEQLFEKLDDYNSYPKGSKQSDAFMKLMDEHCVPFDMYKAKSKTTLNEGVRAGEH